MLTKKHACQADSVVAGTQVRDPPHSIPTQLCDSNCSDETSPLLHSPLSFYLGHFHCSLLLSSLPPSLSPLFLLTLPFPFPLSPSPSLSPSLSFPYPPSSLPLLFFFPTSSSPPSPPPSPFPQQPLPWHLTCLPLPSPLRWTTRSRKGKRERTQQIS